MAYNPNMYNTYGQMYGNSYGQNMYPQQIQPTQPMQQSYGQAFTIKGEIEWVDGEVGAKAYQIPAGMTKPVALWDTNDTVIYLKSMNPYGIPNPIKKIHYQMEEDGPQKRQEQGRLESGDTAPTQQPAQDMSEYVRKDDLEAMKSELKQAIQSIQNTQQSGETRGARNNGKSAV